MRNQHLTIAVLLSLLLALLAACTGKDGEKGDTGATGAQGPAGPAGPPGGTPTTAVEACLGCHGAGGVLPVGNIGEEDDAHHLVLASDSGYVELIATITSVDVTGSSVVITFDVVDDQGDPVTNLFASDGRFAIARLDPVDFRTPSEWVNVGDRLTERFSSGTFDNPMTGTYTYTSDFDPTGVVEDGKSYRVAIQLSAGDLPAENAWCDFDADLAMTNLCTGASVTRNIVQTADCNRCHGITEDTHLAFHGGGRTDTEYCVTCHNPTGVIEFTALVHDIHAGVGDFAGINFTDDLDDCTSCHRENLADPMDDVNNWKRFPTMEACQTCHDDIDIANGVGHIKIDSNDFCQNCHPAEGPRTQATIPVKTVHIGQALTAEGEHYRGGLSGIAIEKLSYANDTITVEYSVSRDGARVDLENDERWSSASGARLTLRVAWDTMDYHNTGSGGTPAQPVSYDALDIGDPTMGDTAEHVGGFLYSAPIPVPNGAENTVGVTIEGRAIAGTGAGDDPNIAGEQVPIRAVVGYVNVEGGRGMADARRTLVDSTQCNTCHDMAGAGISLHGTQRTGETGLCVVCHNPNATDIEVRPADPNDAVDGKREEAIDFKRMIHQIHAGAELQNGLVIYGFRSSVHDYSNVEFIGNLGNCETCHVEGGYSTESASHALPTTIDTGADEADPDDDLNISPIAAVCSSCHDDDVARAHMELNGASFQALDADIR